MFVSLKIVKINLVLTIIRPLCFLISFLPLFFIENRQNNLFITFWILFFWIICALQFFFIKRYKIIGIVYFRKEKLELELNNGEILSFIPNENLNLFIKINGYRFENTQVFYITFSDGLGKLKIDEMDKNYKFNILAEKAFHDNLVKILNGYKQMGAMIDLRKR
ncbi:MAG: hypothetical protein ABR968_09820 [Bacteroidales bacterium]|jgi:hypothetical protein